MHKYKKLLSEVLCRGELSTNRTDTKSISIFSEKLDFNLNEGFPLLTLKFTPFKVIAHELIWFLSGSTNIKYLTDNKVRIWDEWKGKDGEVGKLYGFQWRNWGGNSYLPGIDQISNLIKGLKENPSSRRHIVSTWNVSQLDEMALAPCHILFQCHVRKVYGKEKPVLSLQVYQRSCDLFLGVPFNIASYALLTHILAHCTGMEVGWLHWVGGDIHLYENHLSQAEKLFKRDPLPLSTLQIREGKDENFENFSIDDFILENYRSHSLLSGKVAV